MAVPGGHGKSTSGSWKGKQTGVLSKVQLSAMDSDGVHAAVVVVQAAGILAGGAVSTTTEDDD